MRLNGARIRRLHARLQLHLPEPTDALGGLNSMVTNLGVSLSSPDLVMPILVRSLGGSSVLIGALPAVRFGLYWLPQFLVSGWLQQRLRRLPIYVSLEFGRAAIYGAIALALLLLLPSQPGVLLWTMFLLFAITRVLVGTADLAITDVFGRIVRQTGRARFYAVRSLLGGVGGLTAGLLVSLSLRYGGQGLRVYSLLFLGSGLAFMTAALVGRRLKEPPVRRRSEWLRLSDQWRRVPEILRTPNYARLLAVRFLVAMIRIADPFYVIYAVERLAAPEAIAGLYLSMVTLASLSGNVVWPRLDGLLGRVQTLRLTMVVSLAVPLLALGLGAL
ncbi:MAG: MFS transporter, partial [Chloroflexi bacterium]|nr:MFS transporter [Chloroflexota bacterium]